MSSDPAGFRRHDPAAWTGTLAYRSRGELPCDGAIHSADTPILIDTTVYIDAQVADRLPPAIRLRLAFGPLVHSAVAVSELIANIGLLDPAHSGTARVRAALEAVLARIPPEQIIEPGPAAWFEAAAISGILARTQGLPASDRRKLLNDALMFLTAGEKGAVLVTRNRKDFDLLSRFRPDIGLWLYDRL